MSDPASRFHWPRDGVAVRVPPRRLAGVGARCETIAFAGRTAEPARSVEWDSLSTALPRGSRVVLLVAAEDVSFTAADVPALAGLRLREALPNLVEDRTVADVASLHVALGAAVGTGRARTLGLVDRGWLAAIQVHVVRSGHRVAAIVPESLAIPLVPGAWSLGMAGDGAARRAWLRTDAQEAFALPDDAPSAAAFSRAVARAGAAPSGLDVHVAETDDAVGAAVAAALDTNATRHARDPFAAWLAGQGPDAAYGPPLSLLAFDAGRRAFAASPWRVAALLVVALAVVQIVGMQWEWAGLRGEANALRDRASATLLAAFPDTPVVLDAPLQMSRGLAALRASAGRSDPADFTPMMSVAARVFAALPSNAVRGADYESRVLRLRFAPGNATAADERERFVAAAAQEGYALQFDAAANAAGEAQASLRRKGTGA